MLKVTVFLLVTIVSKLILKSYFAFGLFNFLFLLVGYLQLITVLLGLTILHCSL